MGNRNRYGATGARNEWSERRGRGVGGTVWVRGRRWATLPTSGISLGRPQGFRWRTLGVWEFPVPLLRVGEFPTSGWAGPHPPPTHSPWGERAPSPHGGIGHPRPQGGPWEGPVADGAAGAHPGAGARAAPRAPHVGGAGPLSVDERGVRGRGQGRGWGRGRGRDRDRGGAC